MTLEQLIAELRSVMDTRGPSYVLNAEHVLEEIAKQKDPECIKLLLPFFQDEADDETLMFSIVHLIEAFDNRIYINSLVQNLSPLFERSRYWAIILHIRILNSRPAMETYKALIGTLPNQEKSVVSHVLDAVCQFNSSFESRCRELRETLQPHS